MSGQRRKQQGRRRQGQGKAAKPLDLWRPVPTLADPEPIVSPKDPTMLLRSLGDPPLQGQGAQAEHTLSAVAVRAAALATALAAAGGLLGDADRDT